MFNVETGSFSVNLIKKSFDFRECFMNREESS